MDYFAGEKRAASGTDMTDNKRQKTSAPSKVLHVRGLPNYTTEAEVYYRFVLDLLPIFSQRSLHMYTTKNYTLSHSHLSSIPSLILAISLIDSIHQYLIFLRKKKLA